MKRLYSLVKVVCKQGFDDVFSMAAMQSTKKPTKKAKIAQVIILVVAAIYLGVIIFFPAYFITEQFMELGQPSLIISLLFTIGPIVSLYFAILATPGIFYFANDTEDLITLPLQPWEIVFARFTSAYMQTLIGSSFIYVPVIISYFIIVQPGILFILAALIAFVIVPIIPLVLAYFITVAVMTFIPIVKNKDIFMYFTFAMVIIPSFFVGIFFSGLSEESVLINDIVVSLISGDNTAYKYLNLFLPTSRMLVNWIIDLNIIDLLLSISISLGLLMIITYITQGLYFKGLLSVKETGSKKRKMHRNETEQAIKQNSIANAILKYDLKRILRTPSFALNYFSPMLMIPLFAIFPLLSGGVPSYIELQSLSSEIATGFKLILQEFDTATILAVTLGIGMGLGMFLGNLDASSNTAISREGQTMKEFLHMPLKLSQLVYAKAKLSILVNAIMPSIITVILILVLRPPFLLILAFIYSLVIGILAITFISLLMDVYAPSLNWTTEQQAAKGSFKTILIVVPFIAIPILLVVMSFFIDSYASIIILGFIIPFLTFFLFKKVGSLADTHLVNKIQNM